MSETWTLLTLLGLGVVTLVTRCFFFMSDQEWQLPRWATRGLQYAPIAALSAVIVPELLTTQGQLISSWQEARWCAAAAGAGFYFLRRGRGQVILGTIVVGMAVYLPLHLGLGW
jgi:branched-subunit amino acid transport protein